MMKINPVNYVKTVVTKGVQKAQDAKAFREMVKTNSEIAHNTLNKLYGDEFRKSEVRVSKNGTCVALGYRYKTLERPFTHAFAVLPDGTKIQTVKNNFQDPNSFDYRKSTTRIIQDTKDKVTLDYVLQDEFSNEVIEKTHTELGLKVEQPKLAKIIDITPYLQKRDQQDATRFKLLSYVFDKLKEL